MKVILVGHGRLASGVLSSLELLAGKQDNVLAIDFTALLTSEDLLFKLEEAVKSDAGPILILCDLLGGTPFNQAVVLSRLYPERIAVLAGLNLAMVLELVLGEHESLSAALEVGRQAAISGVMSSDQLLSSGELTLFEEGI